MAKIEIERVTGNCPVGEIKTGHVFNWAGVVFMLCDSCECTKAEGDVISCIQLQGAGAGIKQTIAKTAIVCPVKTAKLIVEY